MSPDFEIVIYYDRKQKSVLQNLAGMKKVQVRGREEGIFTELEISVKLVGMYFG